MRGRNVLMSSDSDEWMTPPDLVESIRGFFLRLSGGKSGITLDPASMPHNPTGADAFYTASDDGLKHMWRGNVFCNPPYSQALDFVDKALTSTRADTILMLLPARTETKWGQLLLSYSPAACFLKGRLKFGSPNPLRAPMSAPFPSVLFLVKPIAKQDVVDEFERHFDLRFALLPSQCSRGVVLRRDQ